MFQVPLPLLRSPQMMGNRLKETPLFRITESTTRIFQQLCVIVQLVALAGLLLLNFSDERLESFLHAVDIRQSASHSLPFWKTMALVALCLSWSIMLIGYVVSIAIGAPNNRTVRQVLALMAMLALGLAVLQSWQRVSWEGRRYRFSSHLNELQSLAHSLEENWPKDDTVHSDLGTIMAYPQWRPSTLLLLTPKRIGNRFHIAAIDRSPQGVLRFELSSGNERIWLEHRTDDKLDAEFANGIQQKFEKERSVRIAANWYLVRYRLTN